MAKLLGWAVSRRIGKLLGIAMVCMAVSGVAYAAIPAAGGVIHACYDSASGKVRVVDPESGSPKPCGKSETALSWNQEGEKGEKGETGAAGPRGLTGPQGGTGPQGPAGVSGLEKIDKDFTSSPPPGSNFHSGGGTIQCPAGKFATGGGYSFSGASWSNGPMFVVSSNHPNVFINGKPQAWTVFMTSHHEFQIRVYAICAAA